jgi:hypothetical protein
MHSGNVLVAEDNPGKITGVIDWQNTVAGFLPGVADVPKFLEFSGGQYVQGSGFLPDEYMAIPRLPADFDSLNDEAKKRAEDELQTAELHYNYAKLVEEHVPLLHQVRKYRTVLALGWTDALDYSGRTWDANGLLQFENALIGTVDWWEHLDPGHGRPCPVTFTEEERKANKSLGEMDELEQILVQLGPSLGIQADGFIPPMVDPEVSKQKNEE